MKLQLAYENELNLINFNDFEDRVKYINDNIFENQDCIFNESNKHHLDNDEELDEKMTFEKFYNIRSLTPRTESEEKQIRDRWLGVKRAGSPYKDESMKLTLDMISNYLLGAKNYSVKHETHVFKTLKKKQLRDEELTKEELKTLKELEKDVVGFRFSEMRSSSDLVMFNNTSFLQLLRQNFKKSKEKNEKERIKYIVTMCNNLKTQAEMEFQVMQRRDERIEFHNEILKTKYTLLKNDRDNKNLFNEIVEEIEIIRYLKKENEISEFKLSYIIDDYLQLTELQVNYE